MIVKMDTKWLNLCLKRCVYYFTMMVFLAGGSVFAGSKAMMVKVSDKDRITLAKATRYVIEVQLSERLSLDGLVDSKTFKLENRSTGKVVDLSWITYGGSDNGGYPAANLYGDLNPESSYILYINFPNADELEDVSVTNTFSASDIPVKGNVGTLVSTVSDRLSFNLSPMASEGTDSIVFEYNFQYLLHQWTPQKGRLKAELTSEGILSTDENDTENQTQLNAGFNLQYHYNWRKKVSVMSPNSGKQEDRIYVYPLGIRIKPAEFESDQSFDMIDYTLKAQVAMALPYSDLPIFWWHSSAGVNRPFFPAVFYAGYSYVSNVENDLGADEINNRWDMELVYSFPVGNTTDLNARIRSFTDLESNETDYFAQVDLVKYFGEKRDKGVKLSYQNGSLPPVYIETETVLLGFSLGF